MKLTVAGIGPGDPELISISALKEAENSDLIIVPRSHENEIGRAEKIILENLQGKNKNKNIIHILFPMIKNPEKRNEIILSQIEGMRHQWENAKKIFFPVIGDSMLFSTGTYLIDILKKIVPDIEVDFIPGISAHSLAAACAKKFLAASDEILSIIPGTAQPEKIINIIKNSDVAAIYKPTAIKNISEIIKDYKKIIRVDFAGIPEKEKIFEGEEALKNINEYFSIIILWK